MPSLQAFNALLEAWASQGNPFEAALVYSKMKQRSISPDLCTFIALFEVSHLASCSSSCAPCSASLQLLPGSGMRHGRHACCAVLDFSAHQ